MKNLNQKQCVNVKSGEGLCIFNNFYGYPGIDKREKYNGPTGKVKDKRDHMHTQGAVFSSLKKDFSFDIGIKIAWFI